LSGLRLRQQPARELLKRTAGEPHRKGVTDAITLALDTVADGDPTGLCRGLVNAVALLSEAGVSRAPLRHHAAGYFENLAAETDVRRLEHLASHSRRSSS
jgi:hypothetical protein